MKGWLVPILATVGGVNGAAVGYVVAMMTTPPGPDGVELGGAIILVGGLIGVAVGGYVGSQLA
jgi:hypothetical protein